MSRAESRPESPAYQVFILALSLFALGALAVRTVGDLPPETRGVLDTADLMVCAVFFLDFLWSLWRAPSRWHYLRTWGWLDLLSSIPTLDQARWGRGARVLRIFRVLRGFKATKILAAAILRRRAESTAMAATLVTLLLLVFSSIAVLHFESEAQSNLKTAEDALWWAFATVTTVGYGDRYPVTTEGRMVAVILMSAGVGLFGIFSGCLAAWFVKPQLDEEEEDIKAEIDLLRQDIAALRGELAAKP